MNTFVTIKHVQDFKEVSYYSLCLDDEKESLYEKFLNKHTANEEIRQELVQLGYWMKTIGDEIGAVSRYFRHEGASGDAKALPPPARFITGEAGNLRLYCMLVNQNVVFLFNGGIKTKNTAQKCPNVSSAFREANTMSKVINQGLKDQDIRWDESSGDIDYDDDLCLYY